MEEFAGRARYGKMYKISNSKSSILGVILGELVFNLGYDNITQQWKIYKVHTIRESITNIQF